VQNLCTDKLNDTRGRDAGLGDRAVRRGAGVVAGSVTALGVDPRLRNPTVRSPCAWALAALCVWALGTSGASGAVNRATTPVCAPATEQPVYTQEGLATWYHSSGHKTALGERSSKQAMTAAHRTLPFGTIVRVTNLENCRVVKVRINDRGPWGRRHAKRILDVSRPAAVILGMTKGGVAKIKIEEFLSDQRAG
jgi:peptidoglycan lytic transglycosylase